MAFAQLKQKNNSKGEACPALWTSPLLSLISTNIISITRHLFTIKSLFFFIFFWLFQKKFYTFVTLITKN
jgi:hypothetical protein